MNYYFGISNHVMDAKGRIFLPSKMRTALGNEFVVARGISSCLSIYTPEAWERVMESILSIPDTDADGQALRRAFLGTAVEVTADEQGRIPFPQHLRDYAKLRRDVAVVGQGELVEVWNVDTWAQYCEDHLNAVAINAKAQAKLPGGLLKPKSSAQQPALPEITPEPEPAEQEPSPEEQPSEEDAS